jgi:hypothetical protein
LEFLRKAQFGVWGVVLPWDNDPVHSARLVEEYQVMAHTTNPPLDLSLADFFLFPKLKKELACRTMTTKEYKKEWG